MENISLKDVAKAVGVSLSTVSKALNDSYEIGKNTKERVREMAKKMNYRPNPYAGFLHTHISKTIAVIIPDINNNFFVQAVKGMDLVAREKNYHLLVYITEDDFEKEKSILMELQNGRVDGIIISVSSNTENYDHIRQIKSSNIGIVFFDRVCHAIETVKVTTDDFESGFKATEHLIENGCKNIAYLSISATLSTDQKRREGYMSSLANHKISPNPSMVKICNTDDRECYQNIKELFLQKDRPDGIFASVEQLAITSYHVAKELNLRIPEDIKIICFSNLPTASLLNPALSTITQPAYEMGRQAAVSLFYYLERKKRPLLNQTVVLGSKLIVRNSTKSFI